MRRTFADLERIFGRHHGPILGVWQTPPGAEGWLTVFAMDGARLKYLAQAAVPAADRARVGDELRRRGIRQGKRAFAGEHIWAVDGEEVSIWFRGALALSGRDGRLLLGDGRVVAREEIATVISFVDEWWIERGVRLDLTNWSRVVVAAEKRLIALADPGYGRNLLVVDASWATDLAAGLAAWLGVPHEDEISGVTRPESRGTAASAGQARQRTGS